MIARIYHSRTTGLSVGLKDLAGKKRAIWALPLEE